MKKILFSLALLFVIAAPSYGQFNPGPGFDHKPGLPDPCTSDLYISHVSALPQSAPAGSVISFQVTVRNKRECHTSPSNLRVQFEYLPFQFHYVDITIPAFSPMVDTHTLTVQYVVPSFLSPGSPVYLSSIWADSFSVINESDETNNMAYVYAMIQVL